MLLNETDPCGDEVILLGLHSLPYYWSLKNLTSMNPGLVDNMESAIVVEGNDLISPKLFRCNIAIESSHE